MSAESRRPYATRPASFAGPLTADDAAVALAEYGIAGGWDLMPPPQDGSAATGRRVLVSYAGRRYLLKQIPWYCDHRPHADAVAAVQDALADLVSLVPRPERTRCGHLLAALPDPADASRERLFLLQPFVPGRPWHPVDADCEAAGQSLGRLHGLLRSRTVSAAGAYVIRLDPFTTAMAALDRVTEQAGPELVTESREVVAQAKEAAAHLGYDAVTVLVHGDPNPGNVIFARDGSVRAVVDWDNCVRDHPAHDLVRMALHLGWLQHDGRTTGFCPRTTCARPDLATAAIEGYRRVAEDWELVRRPLAAVTTAVLTELIALGVLNGWLDHAAARCWRRELPAIAEAFATRY